MRISPYSLATSIVQKLIIALALMPICALGDSSKSTAPTVAVVTSSKVEAYGEALSGLRRELGPEYELVVLDADEVGPSLSKTLSQLNPKLVVAVGSAASRTIAQAGSGIPFLVTMVVGPDQDASLAAPTSEQGAIGVVSLDLPFGKVLRELRTVFPDRTRVGVIYSKKTSGLDKPSLQTAAALQGFVLKTAECNGPEDVVDALVSLKRFVDIVWFPPDGTLFNATTVKPLIMASLRHQMLVAGFSEGFVRAGTAVGVYPDFEAIGRQTGIAVRQFLIQGLLPGRRTANEVRVVLNERILRLLGIDSMSFTGPRHSFTAPK